MFGCGNRGRDEGDAVQGIGRSGFSTTTPQPLAGPTDRTAQIRIVGLRVELAGVLLETLVYQHCRRLLIAV
jgi:hypothetical protein